MSPDSLAVDCQQSQKNANPSRSLSMSVEVFAAIANFSETSVALDLVSSKVSINSVLSNMLPETSRKLSVQEAHVGFP